MFNPNDQKKITIPTTASSPIGNNDQDVASSFTTDSFLQGINDEKPVDSVEKWAETQAIDMNAIIAHQMWTQTENTSSSTTPASNKEATSNGFDIDSLAATSVVSDAAIEKQQESQGGFDLWNITTSDNKDATTQENELLQSIEKAESTPSPKKSGGIIKRMMGLVLIGGGLYGLYFVAAIFYPVEVANIEQQVVALYSDLTASVIRNEKNNLTPAPDNQNTTPTWEQPAPTLREEAIATPIADSIAAQDNIVSNNSDSIAVSNQTRDAWDSDFPNQNSNNGATSVSNIDSDYDQSFDDLEDAFVLSDGALDDYVAKLDQIKDDIERKQGEFKATKNTRGLAIVRTILNRIEELQKMLLDKENTTIKDTIEDDISELDKLLDALNN